MPSGCNSFCTVLVAWLPRPAHGAPQRHLAKLKKDGEEKFEDIVEDTVCGFYGLGDEKEQSLNVLPEEPEFYEVETTLDTGASTHAADRVDFPGYAVEESPGSRAGQLFGCAAGSP